MGVWGPVVLPDVDEQAELRCGIAQPIGAPRLRDAVRRHMTVLILIDDATRFTPTATVLPHVVAELHAAGVPDDKIQFLTAQGTHRKMKEEELKKKLGSLYGKHAIFQHDWKNNKEMHAF